MVSEMPSAVRFFPSDHPALTISARARIEAERKKIIEDLSIAPLGTTSSIVLA